MSLEVFVQKVALEKLQNATAEFLRLASENVEDAEAMIRLAWADESTLYGVFGLIYPFGWHNTRKMVGTVTERLEFINHFVSYYLQDDGYPGLCRYTFGDLESSRVTRVLVPWEHGEGEPLIHPCKEVLEEVLGVNNLPVLTSQMVVEALDAKLKYEQDKWEGWDPDEEDLKVAELSQDTKMLRGWLQSEEFVAKVPVAHRILEGIR